MTTPATMGRIIESLRDRISDAERDSAESHNIAVNSYGAGYDLGFLAALKEVLNEIIGVGSETERGK